MLTFTIIATILSIIATVLSVKAFIFDRKRGRISEAIDIAKEYSQLICEVGVIHNLISWHPEINEIVMSVHSDNIKGFMQSNLSEFFNPSQQTSLDKFFTGEIMDEEVLFKLYILNLGEQALTTDMVQAGKSPYKISVLKTHYSTKIQNLLNSFEYISMSINSNLADDEVIYQSLHQSFLATVTMLYFVICRENKNAEDQYFTNIQALFYRWMEKLNTHAQSEQKSNTKRTKATRKINAPKRKI